MDSVAFIPRCAPALRRSAQSHHFQPRRPRTLLRTTVRRISCVETPPNKTTPPPPASSENEQKIIPPLPTEPGPTVSPDISSDIRATIAWVAVAAGTAAAVAATRGADRGLEFVTAYIVEYSLSVDNLFVFLLIFKFFNVEKHAQARVLTWGIVGAMIMRGGMIIVGEALTKRFEAVSLGFALLLLFSAGKLLFGGEEDEDEDLEENPIVKFSRSLLPFTDKYDGEKFFTMENGVRQATPLMLVLLSIEFSDVVFALDSVPAVLGISDDVLVIYVSNVLAIMGLRNLFFVLSDAIGDLRFLRQALAVVLAFVGGKMAASVGGVQVGVLPSLGVVVGTLGIGVGLSVAFPAPQQEQIGG